MIETSNENWSRLMPGNRNCAENKFWRQKNNIGTTWLIRLMTRQILNLSLAVNVKKCSLPRL